LSAGADIIVKNKLKMPELHPGIGEVMTAQNCMDASQNHELVASLDHTITAWCREIEKVSNSHSGFASTETLRSFYHAHGSRVRRVFTQRRLCVCLFVCCFSPRDISKTDAARTTKLDIQMYHHESWKPIYFWVKRSNVKMMRHKNIADVGHGALVSAGFFFKLISYMPSDSDKVNAKSLL